MDKLYNDIDILIAKFLSGEASPEEAMLLQDWIDQSEANKKIFKATEAAWTLTPSAYQKPDAEQAFQSLQLTRQAKQIRFTPLRIAASIIFILCALVALYFSLRTTQKEKLWITKASTQKSFSWQLPEKTTVTLNENSHIRYPKIFEDIRKVELSGEAYFDVTPDPLKPFVLSANGVEIKVLGTAFNVLAYEADTLVSVEVVHGRVSMKYVTDSLILTAGQKGLFNRITKKLWLERAENHNKIAYATHSFTYSDNSLEQILDDLSAAYGVTFEIENPKVKNCHLTGEYHSLELPVILEVISKSLDLTYNISGNRVYISGDGCL